ncbi:ABC transporter permease [Phaeodactylibacter sp.]|jgi:ABC-type lipoprotein release transport system permease subunit|uniref:ABC transporter permease n=1 Tax=Phaeodactylibacter sp. TaxID=1940289 RepID=UPI0025D32025|nr:ABC transporter permease [Phaeodactylibacter sp.]MCI4651264.1 ABC transporter permease [Phaeodactylibacter sp.]MCI5093241.1 ABC transporter permease [Phaeodactylibacter sp.]
MLFKMAWRNIWRNRRRTFITAASILFAVLFASFMDSLQRGAWDNMINNVVNYYFGYVQVHQDGYWEEQSIDKAFPLADSLEQVGAVEGVEAVLPRLESFALAAAGETTSGVLVAGILPDVENKMTDLENRLVEGEYLTESDEAVLVASGVADKLGLALGDTLVLISQGYRGVNAAGKYPIKGIAKFGSPDLNKQMVYLPLPAAQYFYGAPGLATSLALKLGGQEDIKPVVAALRTQLDTSAYEVMDWEELLPDLVQARELDTAGNVIVYFILYMIIAFGIFGTILMMSKEREYEFGVLISIGLQRWQLALSVWIEVILLGVLGALSGILLSMPIVYYFKVNPIRFGGEMASSLEKFGFEPIFPATFDMQIFMTQALYVFILTAVLALYPIFKIRKLQPVQAMRG